MVVESRRRRETKAILYVVRRCCRWMPGREPASKQKKPRGYFYRPVCECIK